jgi:tetratricopeptide (TPR) repeat protein/predicted aspartyl protease
VRTRHIGCLAILAAAAALSRSGPSAAACQLQNLGTLPVEMRGMHPVVSTKINGVKARFLLDTGSFYSSMWLDAATQYRLPIGPTPDGFYISGMGGRETARVATVESFDFIGIHFHNAQFFVIDQGALDDAVGLMGQNLLRISDVEYDLANGIIRFFKPVHCGGQPLAYWAVSTPFSFVKLRNLSETGNHLQATALIDGRPMSVWFDTGSARSFLSLDAAARVGITPGSPGVAFLGTGEGIGSEAVKTWSAPVATFQLGGEKVQNAHLLMADFEPQRRIGEVGSDFPDVILGDDFFLSHRIYVAYSQKKLYFTYNGGPLFNLDLPQVLSGKAKPPPTVDASAHAAGASDVAAASDAPTTADGFRHRGMAYASMHEYRRAIVDLTQACKLAPGNARNHYERALIYRRDGQPSSALKDLDIAIRLQPDDIDAHLARAHLLQSQPDADPAAVADLSSDLEAVSRLATPGGAVRLTLASMYRKLGNYPAALAQIDEWLGSHPLPHDQAIGLNDRCWLRATANRELHKALHDCDRALDLTPDAPHAQASHIVRALSTSTRLDALDSRGLVYLRLGRPRAAISDYDSALDGNPNIADSLYGRGLAEMRLGRKARAQRDLAAAERLDSGIVRYFTGIGLAH